MSTSMTTPNGAMINIDEVTGWVQLVRVEKVENGRLHMGGYSIRYDRENREVSRTPVTWHGSLGFVEA
jgi:hypothetical protein